MRMTANEIWHGEPVTPLPRWMTFAIVFSLLVHLTLFLWSRGVFVGFGSPVVDPVQPARFHLERATIDPRALEPESRSLPGLRTPDQQVPAYELPGQIEAFSGPLEAPRIPIPAIAERPAALGAGPSPVPVEAFSALPVTEEGRLPRISQALVNEASTAALREAHASLAAANLAGGSDSFASGEGVPGFEDLSSLIALRPPEALQRPAFQPILIRLSNDVLFEFDSARLLPSAEETLTRLAAALEQAVELDVTIEGHTDSIGEPAYNQGLSERRAQSVADWLAVRTGRASDKFKVRGYGSTRPIVAQTGNADEEKRNRRVEVRVEGQR